MMYPGPLNLRGALAWEGLLRMREQMLWVAASTLRGTLPESSKPGRSAELAQSCFDPKEKSSYSRAVNTGGVVFPLPMVPCDTPRDDHATDKGHWLNCLIASSWNWMSGGVLGVPPRGEMNALQKDLVGTLEESNGVGLIDRFSQENFTDESMRCVFGAVGLWCLRWRVSLGDRSRILGISVVDAVAHHPSPSGAESRSEIGWANLIHSLTAQRACRNCQRRRELYRWG